MRKRGKEATGRRYNFSPDYLAAKFCIRQTATSGSCSLPIDQYLPSPRPSGGSLVIIGPGTLPGPMAFVGTRWRGRAGSPAQMAAHAGRPSAARRRTAITPAAARSILRAEPLDDDRRCGMNSLFFPEPTHSRTARQIQNTSFLRPARSNQRKAALSFINAPARRSRRRTTCDMSSKL
jgi:hypothetical protein